MIDDGRSRIGRQFGIWTFMLGLAWAEAAAASAPGDGGLIKTDSNDALQKLSRNAAVVEAGRLLFNASCAVCHLETLQGKGANPAMVGSDLTDTTWDHGGTPADIYATIANGVFDTGMPPWKQVIDDEKISSLVAYILSKHPAGNPALYDTNAGHAAKLKAWSAGFDDVPLPAADESPRLAQIPLRLPAGELVDAVCAIYADGRMLLYDAAGLKPHSVWSRIRLKRDRAALRAFTLEGVEELRFTELAGDGPAAEAPGEPPARGLALLAISRQRDGLRIQTSVVPPMAGPVVCTETLRLAIVNGVPELQRTLSFEGIGEGMTINGLPGGKREVATKEVALRRIDRHLRPRHGLEPAGTQRTPAAENREATLEFVYRMNSTAGIPAVVTARKRSHNRMDPYGGSLERPGYRAVQHPLPLLASGEDRVMPFALAAHPHSGVVYVASGKLGEIFAVRGKSGGAPPEISDFGGSLFQDVLAMAHDGESLLVLHRRGLTRLQDSDQDGVADRYGRILSFPQELDPKAYDWGYGLVRDNSGGYVISFAGHAAASQKIAGAGSAIRATPKPEGWTVEEIAFGMRNPVGWTAGPQGDIFFTDNQGNWMATNRLSQLVPGHYYGFPNPKQPAQTTKPVGPTAVWVPYGWAKSINGVTYDSSAGKFGPFAGHFFLAELMEGGAIIRAQLEYIKGQYQGACFPFWNRGLLGPVTVVFDRDGRLWVGSITEPGWMRQPDRGALYAIGYTGVVPFEIHSLNVLHNGFRIRFTTPPNRRAREAISYRIEHYRYEYSSAYGSRELDRTAVPVESVALQPDGCAVDVILPEMIRGRIYRITVDGGVNSQQGEPLFNGSAAYTLNEIPDKNH